MGKGKDKMQMQQMRAIGNGNMVQHDNMGTTTGSELAKKEIGRWAVRRKVQYYKRTTAVRID